ncbi:MAG: GatB/YqeY domain-containing protein [Bacteroidia bacterium]|nr:GatB/YqeY domain-containing protein [Bacteroidia bacterium]
MELEKKINNDIKQAMLSKDSRKLAALRAIKAALLLEKTGKDVTAGVIPDEVELKMLQKLVKQRREAAAIYVQQNRPDLAEEETYQATIIEAYLPAKLSEEELRNMIAEAIKTTGASGIKEMGKVMGLVSKQVAGRADNSLIATLVKEMLS